MSAGVTADWIVLKFGDESVSARGNWLNSASVMCARRASGAPVLSVHSALVGVTDLFEKLLRAALRGTYAPLRAALDTHHRNLAAELHARITSAYTKLPILGWGHSQRQVQSDHVARLRWRPIPRRGPHGPTFIASLSVPP